MRVGVSTASLFLRKYNEECFDVFREQNIDICELFFNTNSEYTLDYAKLINSKKGNVHIHSFHSLCTQFEPQLYSRWQRVKDDAFAALDTVLKSAKEMNIKFYTFHGIAYLKNEPIHINIEDFADKTNQIIDKCKKYDITLAYENVHYSAYKYAGFFSELKARCKNLKGTLDIKQAKQSQNSYQEYIADMRGDIVTVHLADYDITGKRCLPGKGVFDFAELFDRLSDSGSNPNCFIEAYREDFDEISELKQSCDYLKEILYKRGNT